jgi:predicted nucleic acid-binding protein
VTHTIHDKLKEAERRFFHHTSNLHLLSIPVHPGDKTAEQRFVKQLLPDFDCREHDPSDAVILAVAVKIHANILTRDKHDLFNVALKNCLNDYDIKVFNTFPNR